jgi:hypothetical protein
MRKAAIQLLTMSSFLVVALFAGPVTASPVTVPLGLNPGDNYRLVFATAGVTTAASSDIGYYNTFVTTQANSSPELAALGVAWYAIGSTTNISAFDNIGGNFVEPIYRLNGDLVASNAGDLWDSSISNAIRYDQNGTLINGSVPVFTGTLGNGTKAPFDYELGDVGNVFVKIGYTNFSSLSWVENTQLGYGNLLKMYGISDMLTVPGVTGVGDAPFASELRLAFAGPNPTSGESHLTLALSRDGLVRVVLYDLRGRAVSTLLDGWQAAGTRTIVWNGRSETGAAAPAGLYFMRAESEGQSIVRRIVHVR